VATVNNRAARRAVLAGSFIPDNNLNTSPNGRTFVARGTYIKRGNRQSTDRHGGRLVVACSNCVGDFVESGGQKSHDEGSETRAPKTAKAMVGSVEIEGGAHRGGCRTE
jgi:hypothetical protein